MIRGALVGLGLGLVLIGGIGALVLLMVQAMFYMDKTYGHPWALSVPTVIALVFCVVLGAYLQREEDKKKNDK